MNKEKLLADLWKCDNHPFFEKGLQVFECLLYIHEQIEAIKQAVANNTALRHPINHFMFYRVTSQTVDEVQRELSELVAEVQKRFDMLYANPDETYQQLFMQLFLFHIVPDMRAMSLSDRLKPALQAFDAYLSCTTTRDLLKQFEKYFAFDMISDVTDQVATYYFYDEASALRSLFYMQRMLGDETACLNINIEWNATEKNIFSRYLSNNI